MLCLGIAYATDDIKNDDWFDRLLQKLGSSDEVDLNHGIDWGFLPGPFYNPGLGLGFAAIGLYKPDSALLDTQLSTLTIRGFISTTGAAGFNFDSNTFFGDDGWRLFINGSATNVPTYYWGIGTRRAEDDNKEKYTQQRVTGRANSQ